MPGALVVKSVAMAAGSAWTKLSAARQVLDATLIARGDNSAAVKIRFDGAPSSGADWPAGLQADIGVQDLSRVEVSGTEGDIIDIVARGGQ